MKNKNGWLYCSILILSIILFVIAMCVLGDTKIAAPVIIVLSLYLFIGSTIKLCKTNDKLKNTFLCFFDLLFWLP